jgi:hypothetical protein
MSDTFLTRVRFRLALWFNARLLPLQLWRDRPLADVLSLADAAPGGRYVGLPAGYVLKRVLKTTRRPLLMRDRRCLRQGILAFKFMNAAGYRSELHFGVDRASVAGPVKAHCWLVHDGKIVLNPPDSDTVPILIHSVGATQRFGG